MARRFRRQVRVAEAWWQRLAPTAPSGLGGLWFGIVELASPSTGWHLYVAGTETFDAEDETAEWAVPDYAWWPEDRYTPIPVDPDEDYEVTLGRVADLVRDLAPWEAVPVAGVAVGYDDGDFEIVYQG